MALTHALKDQSIQASLVINCLHLIDQQVAAKGGLSGLALKTTYGVVKGIGPTYLSGAIERLLPEMMAALDPLWIEGLQTGNPIDYLTENRGQTADRLLSVTDGRIAGSRNTLVKTSYSRLRQSVKHDVEAAVPGLAKILGDHVGTGG